MNGRLRGPWGLVWLLVPAFVAGAAAAFVVQDRSHAALEEAFQRELGVLVLLPRLRADVARLERATEQYLLTGQARHREERGAALADLRRLEDALAGSVDGAEEKALSGRLARELAGLLSEQERWVARRAQGRLARGSRPPSAEGAVAELTATLARLKDSKRAALEERRREVGRSGRLALALLLASGALAAGLVASELASRAEKAAELARLKTQLVAMVSHEFNNSLSVVGGMTRLLRDDGAPPDERRANYLTIIESHVKSLGTASRTLLELGRLEAGRLTVHPRRMDLAALARAAAGRLEVLWTRKGQTLALELPEGPVWVEGDPDALSLVASNLIGNAVKYTPEKGRIAVRVEAEGPGARFSVADTGIGIAPEDQARIFSGYYRTDEGKKAAKGFGVGLALTQALVSAHGAELKVESAPGAGSRFSFFLPGAAG